MNFKEFLKTHQQKIVLIMGYLLVASLGFMLGKMTAFKYDVPEVRVEESFAPLPNNSQNSDSVQSASVDNSDAECAGLIKGNISSGGEKIYHMPGGAFYTRTNPEMCFATEAEAQAAGFRKSSR